MEYCLTIVVAIPLFVCILHVLCLVSFVTVKYSEVLLTALVHEFTYFTTHIGLFDRTCNCHSAKMMPNIMRAVKLSNCT